MQRGISTIPVVAKRPAPKSAKRLMAARYWPVNRDIRQFSCRIFAAPAQRAISNAASCRYSRRHDRYEKARNPQRQPLRQAAPRLPRPEERRRAGLSADAPPVPPGENAAGRAGAPVRPAHGTRRARQSTPQDQADAGDAQCRRTAGASPTSPPCPSPAELVEPREIDKITGTDAVHQGVLIEAEPLKPKRADRRSATRRWCWCSTR